MNRTPLPTSTGSESLTENREFIAQAQRVRRDLTLLIVVVCTLIAFLVPLSVVYVSYRDVAIQSQALVEYNANQISRLVARNPGTWQFLADRYEDLLTDQPMERDGASYRLTTLDKTVILDTGTKDRWIDASWQTDVTDGVNSVGILTATRSLLPATTNGIIAAIGGLLSATLIFISIRFLAFRFIDYAVKVRTAEYQESQEQLMRMMRQREEAENRFHRASEAGRVGWWEWNLTTDEMHVSPILRELLGLTVNEGACSVDEWLRHVHPEDSRELMSKAKRHIAGDLPEFVADHRMIHRDGSIKWFACRGTVVNDENDHPARMVGTNTEITERVVAEEQVRQFQMLDSLGSLAGGVAHEINNMLQPMMGLTESALACMQTDDPGRLRLQKVLEASDRMKHLVNGILTFSRGSETLESLTELTRSVDEALMLVRAITPSNVEFKSEIERGPIFVRVAPNEIHTIVMNLTSNALDAIDNTPGVLDVGLYKVSMRQPTVTSTRQLEAGDYAVLSIRDTGHGMEEETLKRAFDPFFTTKEVGEGTGMGLSIVYGIVTKREGAIDVTSDRTQGTTIQVYFPFAQ
jgi:PAS domain S-box-containing protein